MSAQNASSVSAGFYTVAEAARLIRAGNVQRIYGWLRGYAGRDTGPLVKRDYEPWDHVQELSFLDLMEVRVVEHFREHGVKVRSLRIAAERLRRDLATDHPFATDRLHLVADKSDIFILETFRAAASDAEDRRFRSLLSDNYVFYEVIRQSLLPGVEFDRRTRLARTWIPRPEEFPRVKVDPLVAFGQPAIARGVPTEALYHAWLTEKRSTASVSFWYGVPADEVEEAVRFHSEVIMRGVAAAA